MKFLPALLLVASSAMLLQPANAQHVPCSAATNAHRAMLDKKYELEGVRGFYAVSGTHALANQTDQNANGVPDIVEDAVRHVTVFRKLSASLGFRDPLESPRFRAAEVMDVEFLDFSTAFPDMAASGGIASSSVTKVSGVPIREEKCAIYIALNAKKAGMIDRVRGTLIPHETFHLYQYGYTMFRIDWFLEGMARWAEWSTVSDPIVLDSMWTTPLPATYQALESQVFLNPDPYDARKFWGRLAYLSHAAGKFTMPASVASAKFANNASVVNGDVWRGYALMQNILQTLDAEADMATLDNAWPRYQWDFEDQFRPVDNHRIMRAVQRVVARLNLNTSEVNAFLAIALP